MDNFFSLFISSHPQDYKCFDPLCYFPFISVSDVQLWILKDKVLFPVFRCQQMNWSSVMSSKVNGEKEHVLGAINIVRLGHPD